VPVLIICCANVDHRKENDVTIVYDGIPNEYYQMLMSQDGPLQQVEQSTNCTIKSTDQQGKTRGIAISGHPDDVRSARKQLVALIREQALRQDRWASGSSGETNRAASATLVKKKMNISRRQVTPLREILRYRYVGFHSYHSSFSFSTRCCSPMTSSCFIPSRPPLTLQSSSLPSTVPPPPLISTLLFLLWLSDAKHHRSPCSVNARAASVPITISGKREGVSITVDFLKGRPPSFRIPHNPSPFHADVFSCPPLAANEEATEKSGSSSSGHPARSQSGTVPVAPRGSATARSLGSSRSATHGRRRRRKVPATEGRVPGCVIS
jgi:hypothetical protein